MAKPQTVTSVVLPNPVISGEEYQIDGAGYPPEAGVNISYATPGCCTGAKVGADEDGEIALGFTAGRPGTYVFSFFLNQPKGRSGKFRLRLVDTLEFECVE